jgi:hypothetical protein
MRSSLIGMSKGGARKRRLVQFREVVEREYLRHPTGCGGSFGEILCFELHNGDREEFLDYASSLEKIGVHAGCDFVALAHKWHVPVAFLGDLIADHCRELGNEFP